MPDDAEKKYTPFKSDENQRLAFWPEELAYVPVDDVTEEAIRESEGFGPTREERAAFYRQKISLMEDIESRFGYKDSLLTELRESAREDSKTDDALPDPRPIPGGVGYGAYFRETALHFQDFSVLYYHIVAVKDIGHQKNQWLYLTSTNRSPRGVEAYLSYTKRSAPVFSIFDWSKGHDGQFALSLPYAKLSKYLGVKKVEGRDYVTIYVMNSTQRVAGHDWRNEVLLYNRQTSRYELVYKHEYKLDPWEEFNYRTWGPIVETFKPFPYDTDIIGFFDAQMLQDDKPPTLLTNEHTFLDPKHAHDPGFKSVHNRPNYSFTVHW